MKGPLPDGRPRHLEVRDFDEAQTLAAFRTPPTRPLPSPLRPATAADLTQGQLVQQSAYQQLPLTCAKLAIYAPRKGEE